MSKRVKWLDYYKIDNMIYYDVYFQPKRKLGIN